MAEHVKFENALSDDELEAVSGGRFYVKNEINIMVEKETEKSGKTSLTKPAMLRSGQEHATGPSMFVEGEHVKII